jgi:hypothetical protein
MDAAAVVVVTENDESDYALDQDEIVDEDELRDRSRQQQSSADSMVGTRRNLSSKAKHSKVEQSPVRLQPPDTTNDKSRQVDEDGEVESDEEEEDDIDDAYEEPATINEKNVLVATPTAFDLTNLSASMNYSSFSLPSSGANVDNSSSFVSSGYVSILLE